MNCVRIIFSALLGILLLATAKGIHAQTASPLNSQATYLLTSADVDTLDAPPIDLSLLGLHAGDLP